MESNFQRGILFPGLIACLIPYVYFSFQFGPLYFKSFKLVSYILKVLSWSKTLLTWNKLVCHLRFKDLVDNMGDRTLTYLENQFKTFF